MIQIPQVCTGHGPEDGDAVDITSPAPTTPSLLATVHKVEGNSVYLMKTTQRVGSLLIAVVFFFLSKNKTR